MSSPFIFILYDGIKNSVFQSQVLRPLEQQMKHHPGRKVIIVSFERSIPGDAPLFFHSENNESIQLICRKRAPFLGKITLLHSAYRLKKILRNYPSYHLVARGPLAGWTAFKALCKKRCLSFKLQARGILEEEYRYTHNATSLFHRIRSWQLKKIEQSVYKTKVHDSNAKIEAVSPALISYLCSKYHANKKRMELAQYDIPSPIPSETIIEWRYKIRNQLDIADTTHVYCYNGSAKSWQCLAETITFFKTKCLKKQNCFLLILSQDYDICMEMLKNAHLDEKTALVLNVEHRDIYRYLAACDTGIIFRKASPVNWVARPTKAIEYKAAGLNIVHNNTVDWLIKNATDTSSSIDCFS